MPLDPSAKQTCQGGEIEFFLTAVCEHREFPGVWGFEVFTKEWLYLGRFIYRSEADANRAANEFVWVMEKISSISRPSETLCLDRAIKLDEEKEDQGLHEDLNSTPSKIDQTESDAVDYRDQQAYA